MCTRSFSSYEVVSGSNELSTAGMRARDTLRGTPVSPAPLQEHLQPLRHYFRVEFSLLNESASSFAHQPSSLWKDGGHQWLVPQEDPGV